MQQFDELQNRFKTLDAKYAEADAFRSKIMGAVAPDAEDKADPKAYLGVAEEALREANIVHLAASQRVRFPGDLAAVLSRDPAYAVDLKTRRLKDPVAAESAMTAFLATPRGKQWVEAPVATPPAPPAPTGTAPTPGQVPPVPPPAGNANGTPPPPAAADPNAAPAKRTFKNIIFKKP